MGWGVRLPVEDQDEGGIGDGDGGKGGDGDGGRRAPWVLHDLKVESVGFCAFAVCEVLSAWEGGDCGIGTGDGVDVDADADDGSGGVVGLEAEAKSDMSHLERGESDTVPPSNLRSETAAETHDESSRALLSSTSTSTEPQLNPPDILLAVPTTVESQISIIHLPSEKRLTTVPAPRLSKPRAGMVMAMTLVPQPTTLLVLAGYESGHTCIFSCTSSTLTTLISPSSTTTPPSPPTWQNIYTSRPHSEPILSLCAAPSQKAYFTSSADAIIAKHALPDPLFPNPPSTQNTPPPPQPTTKTTATTTTTVTDPLLATNTRHAGQQSLTARSDGRLVATAGWDARVRVYSARSLVEVAVLKWHREGVFAVAFADVGGGDADGDAVGDSVGGGDANGRTGVMRRETVAGRREERARRTHWVAAGAKDGKVSLWDVF